MGLEVGKLLKLSLARQAKTTAILELEACKVRTWRIL